MTSRYVLSSKVQCTPLQECLNAPEGFVYAPEPGLTYDDGYLAALKKANLPTYDGRRLSYRSRLTVIHSRLTLKEPMTDSCRLTLSHTCPNEPITETVTTLMSHDPQRIPKVALVGTTHFFSWLFSPSINLFTETMLIVQHASHPTNLIRLKFLKYGSMK